MPDLLKTVHDPLDRWSFSIKIVFIAMALLPFLFLLGQVQNILDWSGIKGEVASVLGVMALIYTLSVVGLILVISLYFMLRRLKDIIENRYNLFVSMVVLLIVCNILPNGPVLAVLLLMFSPGKKYFDQFSSPNLTLLLTEKVILKLKSYLIELRNVMNNFRLRLAHLF